MSGHPTGRGARRRRSVVALVTTAVLLGHAGCGPKRVAARGGADEPLTSSLPSTIAETEVDRPPILEVGQPEIAMPDPTIFPPPPSPDAVQALPRRAQPTQIAVEANRSRSDTCAASRVTFTIRVASDDREVTAVRLNWIDPGAVRRHVNSTTATAPDTWVTTVGPFNSSGTLVYQAVANDGPGSTVTSEPEELEVRPCPTTTTVTPVSTTVPRTTSTSRGPSLS